MKKILFDKEARNSIRRGVKKAVDAVKITMGPRGENVMLYEGYGSPTITNDGVSIIKKIEVDDLVEQSVIEAIKDVAIKSEKKALDGTSATIVMSGELINLGMDAIDAGISPIDLKDAFNSAKDDIVLKLNSQAKKEITKEDLINVATVSSESRAIGELVADVVEKVGKDGIISIIPSIHNGIVVDIIEGLTIETTPIYGGNIGKSKVLIADTIYDSKTILDIVDSLHSNGESNLVVISSIEGEAESTIKVLNDRESANILAIKKPEYIEDIKALTGYKEGFEYENLGEIDGVLVKDGKVVFIGGNKKTIKQQSDKLKEKIETTKSSIEKERLLRRLGNLTGNTATISIGVNSETEFEYIQDKLEDTIGATKGALAEGILIGGGCSLAKIELDTKEERFKEGYKIVSKAIEAPLRQIIKNSGRKDDSVVVKEIKKGNKGYNALNNKIEDIFKEGIVDPLRVVRTSLENAISVSSVLLTTGAIVINKPEEDNKEFKK